MIAKLKSNTPTSRCGKKLDTKLYIKETIWTK